MENPRIVAPAAWAATVFSTAGGSCERLIFFSCADAAPANNSPLAAIAPIRLLENFEFMFPPERRGRPRWLVLVQRYAQLSKRTVNAGGHFAPMRFRAALFASLCENRSL